MWEIALWNAIFAHILTDNLPLKLETYLDQNLEG